MIVRSFARWSVAVCLLAQCATSIAAGRDERTVNSDPDRTWARTVGGIFGGGRSVAVVIGISDYLGEPAGGYKALGTTAPDSAKMVRFLRDEAGFDIIYLITDDKATKQRIDSLMTDEIPRVVGTRDRFLFYWSGHGDQMFGAGKERAFGFLPLANSRRGAYSTMVSMDDISRWDSYLSSRHALFILDACLSGLAGVERKTPHGLRLDQLSNSAHQLLTAGTETEEVLTGDRWTGSLFTDSFIIGAMGEARKSLGVVTIFSLLDFIQERVVVERTMANWSKSLTPQIRHLRGGNNGAFFFVPKTAALTSRSPPILGPPAPLERIEPETKAPDDQPSPAPKPPLLVPSVALPSSSPNAKRQIEIPRPQSSQRPRQPSSKIAKQSQEPQRQTPTRVTPKQARMSGIQARYECLKERGIAANRKTGFAVQLAVTDRIMMSVQECMNRKQGLGGR